MFELSQKTTEIYRKKKTNHENENGRDLSDTLITKILLDVFGCTPAYDRYFNQHKAAFEAIRFEISKNGVEYPPIKIIDMCFCQIGYDHDIQLQEIHKNCKEDI
ncbi:hypothetical protein BN3590_01386 [Clostridium sp. C105KSO15]|nr:hypothetical protein BN3590_01386 [Clostridium sp. C105KSO15]